MANVVVDIVAHKGRVHPAALRVITANAKHSVQFLWFGRLVRYLVSYDPDVICFQESKTRTQWLRRWCQSHPEWHLVTGKKRGPRQQNPILVRIDRLTVKYTYEDFMVSREDSRKYPPPRYANRVEFYHDATGHTVMLTNHQLTAHAEHSGKFRHPVTRWVDMYHKHMERLDLLMDHIKKSYPKAVALTVGDWNFGFAEDERLHTPWAPFWTMTRLGFTGNWQEAGKLSEWPNTCGPRKIDQQWTWKAGSNPKVWGMGVMEEVKHFDHHPVIVDWLL